MLYAQLSMIYRQSRKEHACWKCSCMGLMSRLGLQFQHIQVCHANLATCRANPACLRNGHLAVTAVVRYSFGSATGSSPASLKPLLCSGIGLQNLLVIDLQTQHSSMMPVLMPMQTQLWLHIQVGPLAISECFTCDLSV